MKFDKKRFLKNADSVCRQLLPESHRNVLDGKEVINGEIEYSITGEDYYIYPVLPEWCAE